VGTNYRKNMSTLKLNLHETNVTVKVEESDEFTKLAYLKLEKTLATAPEKNDLFLQPDTREVRHCNEMFMTPDQLETLGKFLVEEAEKMRNKGNFFRNFW